MAEIRFPTLDVLPTPRAKNVLPRAAIPAGDCLCDHCIGKCCRYFSLPIRDPITWDDFDEVRQLLAHGQTIVYVESGTWFLLVSTRCRYLTAEDRCAIYHDRPKICREYTADECEYDDDWSFERLFVTPEQAGEYAEAILPPRRGVGPAAVPGEVVLPIREPVSWDDFDEVRWFLAHGQTTVTVEAGAWYLRVANPLAPDPASDRARERVFEAAEQVWEYAEAILLPRRPGRAGSAASAAPDASLPGRTTP